jgi:hypothetical protein
MNRNRSAILAALIVGGCILLAASIIASQMPDTRYVYHWDVRIDGEHPMLFLHRYDRKTQRVEWWLGEQKTGPGWLPYKP